MKKYDITFLGHMCIDEIVPYEGETRIAPGSAVLCGAMVAARIGMKTAAIVKMAAKDEAIIEPMREAGIDVYLIPAEETTYSQVIHPVADVDVRRLILKKSAGLILINEVPQIETKYLHLAGISDTEFDMELIKALKDRGYNLSLDMQSFVRQVDLLSREISIKDVKNKKDLIPLMSKVKLDIAEAKVLTGTDNLEAAAVIFESWGCPETVITKAEGVVARAGDKTYFERFSNKSIIGRTGRGDTTFAAYLSFRMNHGIEESLKFAATLVSIKMESTGPFSGTIQDVFNRMKEV